MAKRSENRGNWPCVSTLAAVTLVLCGGCSQEPATTRHELRTFSISVPTTWTRADHRPDGPEGAGRLGGEGVRFEGPGGEYVDVAIDAGMGISSADTWLKAKLGSNGEVITVGENKLCEKTPPDPNYPYIPECTRGDGRLDVWLFFEARGHGYVIMMGNSKRETPEGLAIARKIVEAMKLK